MGGQTLQPPGSAVWALANRQHGVLTRDQLRELGFSRHAIDHRIGRGRLHPVRRGVSAVGRPDLSREGEWMAAVLVGGPGAVLSHASAAALWQIGREDRREIHVSTASTMRRRQPGLVIHRRRAIEATRYHDIPVTTPIVTLIDIDTTVSHDDLEATINEADKRDLTSPELLRSALDDVFHRPGAARLRNTLDHRTFRLTDSALERRFLPLARQAGLPPPQTDGLRYHRSPLSRPGTAHATRPTRPQAS